MGLFNDNDEQNKNESNMGWNAITSACEKVYSNQKAPKHYGVLIS